MKPNEVDLPLAQMLQMLQSGQFANTAQGQALAQALQQRQLPLNEISALMSGSQIQNPQFQGYQGANVQAPNIMQAQQLQEQQAGLEEQAQMVDEESAKLVTDKAALEKTKADIAAEYIFAAAAKMLQLQHEQKSRPPPHSRVLLQRPQPMQGCYRDTMRSLPPSLPSLRLKMSHRLENPLLHRR
jgi:hypothetical protein